MNRLEKVIDVWAHDYANDAWRALSGDEQLAVASRIVGAIATPRPSELPIGAQEVAHMFRALDCTSCQVYDGCPVWYFEGGLVVRCGEVGFWFSVSPVRS